MSTLTTENMKQYNNVADNFPNCRTPSKSGISTPAQTSGQAKNHLDNLTAIASVPAPKRLIALYPEIGKEVEARKQAGALNFGKQQENDRKVVQGAIDRK